MKKESKVAAGFGSQKESGFDMETLQEEQKHADAVAKIEQLKQLNRSKVAEMLKQKVFIQEWTHPCLFQPEWNRQASVSEFYPEINLAVDKFYHKDDHEMRLAEFKKKALNEAGFLYVCLTPDKDFADALVEIEMQSVKKVA